MNIEALFCQKGLKIPSIPCRLYKLVADWLEMLPLDISVLNM